MPHAVVDEFDLIPEIQTGPKNLDSESIVGALGYMLSIRIRQGSAGNQFLHGGDDGADRC